MLANTPQYHPKFWTSASAKITDVSSADNLLRRVSSGQQIRRPPVIHRLKYYGEIFLRVLANYESIQINTKQPTPFSLREIFTVYASPDTTARRLPCFGAVVLAAHPKPAGSARRWVGGFFFAVRTGWLGTVHVAKWKKFAGCTYEYFDRDIEPAALPDFEDLVAPHLEQLGELCAVPLWVSFGATQGAKGGARRGIDLRRLARATPSRIGWRATLGEPVDPIKTML